MQKSDKKGHYAPFIVMDQFTNVTSFNIDAPGNNILFKKTPRIGQSISDIADQDHLICLLKAVDECLIGHTVLINNEDTEKILNPSVKLEMLLIPLTLSSYNSHIVLLFLSDLFPLNRPALNQDYSRFASHELRAPISNILSLANYRNYPQLASVNGIKIKETLTAIYDQAEKLDAIIYDQVEKLDGAGRTLNDFTSKQNEFADEGVKKDEIMASHIVLVDDDLLANMMHKRIIKNFQKAVSVQDFNDPAQALRYINKNQPDLILLDINMPEIDGWEFLRLMDAYSLDIPVIMVSSSIDEREESMALEHACVKGFINKPMTEEHLRKYLSSSSRLMVQQTTPALTIR